LQTGNQLSSFNHVQPENNHPTQLFKQVLANTATLTDLHADQLNTLLYSFPQCGVLHAIQAIASNTAYVSEAAAWFGTSALLEKVVKAPQTLPVVTPASIIVKTRPKPIQQQSFEEQAAETQVTEAEPEIIEPFIAASAQPDVAFNEAEIEQEPGLPPNAPHAQHKEPAFAPPIFKEQPFDETQKLIIENLAANDYFVFDKAFADRNQMPEEAITPEIITEPVTPPVAIVHPAEEGSGIARYHDDKMPYSFLWWLDKTRSKHSQIYQPFAKPAAVKNVDTAHDKIPVEDRSKEEEIVERFIQEEPQMRPPSGDKLDNENKAKQSVEDQEELITETLARIYADQMLFSKAIAAYKILMLKNPEKRRYFASQIENLEKKIN
jgi:hypothetical protein